MPLAFLGRPFHILKHQQGLRLLAIVGLFLCSVSYLPPALHQLLYTISLSIKTLLLWLMPFIVLFYVAYTIKSFKRQAPLFLVTLLLFEGLSNFSCLWYAYSMGTISKDFITAIPQTLPFKDLQPLWQFPWVRPSWYGVDKTAFLGVFLGFMAMVPALRLKEVIQEGKKAADFILTRIFSKLIPLFVIGFLCNLYVSGLFHHLCTNLPSILPWLMGGLGIYVALLFFISAQGSLRKTVFHIKNLLPAGGLALSSGCSLSTMPWTIEGTRKNLDNPELANAIIPATTNIQQIGDCIINGFLSYIIYTQFMTESPSLSMWITFSLVFTVARFTTAAVLGGAIFIMLPIYETYLHFTPSMIALILAFNVLLDPIVTSSNVMANGALCSLFETVWKKIIKIQSIKRIFVEE